MKYNVYYNNNVNAGTVPPSGLPEVIQHNVADKKQRLAANWKALESSKLLEGLTVLFHIKSMGVMTVTGEADQIKALDAFLRSQKIGSAGEQIRIREVEEALKKLKQRQ